MTNRFIKKLDGCIKHYLKKASDAKKLYDQMGDLKGKSDDESKKKL